ncbi:MAG: MOSC domain-containing protein [Leptolyngbya sp. SIO4C1]|nr:MOSC domain-containing protein [Leptolyngbya sp. SIO4C1]
MPLTLSQLNIYPVKSAAGLSLSQATVEARGLQFDRRWMVADLQGKFMTQRKFPRLALMQVAIEEDELRLEAPDRPALRLPLVPAHLDHIEVEVWGDLTQAVSLGAEAQQWVSDFLQVPCQLVYMPDTAQRPTAHGKLGEDKLVSFADAYPFLLISEASLAHLNDRLEAPVPMNRFRPNLVVSGCEAHAEDSWAQIRVGEIVFELPKGCDRCSIPGVDQATGIQHKEPLKTLATYRRWDSAIWFGQNLLQQNLGQLQVGDRIEVLARK